jgi:hypothetical protein
MTMQPLAIQSIDTNSVSSVQVLQSAAVTGYIEVNTIQI